MERNRWLGKTDLPAGIFGEIHSAMPDGVCVVTRYVGLRAGTGNKFEEALAMRSKGFGRLLEEMP